MAQAFSCHFQYNIEIVPDRLSLTKLEKKNSESFREYGFRWREQVARVDPPMKESEMVDYFLQALEPTYYGHLVSAIGKSFNEVVKMGGMVEEGLKSNKIMSYSAIKATTQVIQGGTGGIGKKKREDVAMVDSGTWLRQLDMLILIQSKLPNPPPKNLDYSVIYEYCSGTPCHDTEKCWLLKSAIQELIDTNQIEVQALESPNINQNLMPAHMIKIVHEEANMIEIVHEGGEPKKPSQTVMMIRSSGVKTVEQSTSEKSVLKSSERSSEPSIIVKKGSSSDVVAKVISWNYERVTVTYKGKEIKEDVCETQGLTRLRRCFASEELRKPKISKDNLVLVKKVVIKEEAEEFLRKMKAQDYSIVEKLRKTPAQISLEGTEHNRALYLTAKYENSVVTRVLVDNGSSANICPLYTLSNLKVEDEKIHKNSICVWGIDSGGKDSVGDIMLELTIGPVEFTMEFHVLDVAVSYNLLLGRPWIHAAKAVPSALHQMVKFEWDRQEIVVHGDDSLCAHSDAIVPFIEMEDDKSPWVYQVFDMMLVEKVPKGKYVPYPKIIAVLVMVAYEMLKNGFVLGKGLGSYLQGII
ncbi:uncharacterized protein [Nicotiana sylvestris]|uniref:uncharacterized protein n=1 Tax=Nicotiana sylvestris TaxID=4096 RepID=UPI00388C927F